MAKRGSERSESRHAGTRPGQHEKGGGNFGFPPGSTVTVTEAMYCTWEDAGERAISKGRSADDPALKIVGEIEGIEDARTVHLGCGKAARLTPSADGEYLDIAEGSAATGLGDTSNAAIFLNTIHPYHKTDNPTGQSKGSLAVPEDLHDEGVSALLVGLVFVAGAKKIVREGLEGEGTGRPTLVAEEVVKLPKAARAGAGAGAKKKGADAEEEEEEPAPRKKKAKADAEEEEPEADAEEESDDADADAPNVKAERYTLKALAKKKKSGILVEKAYADVFPFAREDSDKRDVMEFVKDEEWLQNKKRPWVVKGDSIFPVPE